MENVCIQNKWAASAWSLLHVSATRAIRDYAARGEPASFLALFTQLRSICDVDPATGASSKFDRIEEIVSDVRQNEEKVVIFSYLLDPLAALGRRLAVGAPDKVLAAAITGEMPLDARSEAIRRFRSDPSVTVLLASTRVASEGVTLTEANHVVFVNRWWNPSANDQARDRVVRIGQRLAVSVYSFTCQNTVEAGIRRILAEKQLTFDLLVNALAAGTEGEKRVLIRQLIDIAA